MRTLPPLLVLTDRTQVPAGRTLVEQVRACVDAGARAVVLREKDRARDDRAALAAELRAVLGAVDGVLLVASDPTIEFDGVHLAASDPFPSPRPAIVGRSCHDLAEVRAAEAEGCDYVTLSPIFESASKPGYGPPLGIEGLQAVCDAVSVPVYALGGLTFDDVDPDRGLDRCRTAGATGIALMHAAMSRPTPTPRNCVTSPPYSGVNSRNFGGMGHEAGPS